MQLSNLLHHLALLGLASAVTLPRSSSPIAARNALSARQTCPNDIHSNQQTTYYTSGTDPNQITACGTKYDPTAMTAAISTELESAIGGIDNACSRQIVVIDAQTGNQIQLGIEDSNATGDLGEYALDITPAAYEALGGSTDDSDPGQRTITWYLVDGVAVCF